MKNIELNALPIYDDKYIITKIRWEVDQVYFIFRGLNKPENDIQGESSHSYWFFTYLQKQILYASIVR